MSFYCKNCKTKPNPRKIDKCMERLLAGVNQYAEHRVVGCCCGHSRYPATIIIKEDNWRIKKGFYCYELFSGKIIPRKTRFYKRDKNGIFYLPECAK